MGDLRRNQHFYLDINFTEIQIRQCSMMNAVSFEHFLLNDAVRGLAYRHSGEASIIKLNATQLVT